LSWRLELRKTPPKLPPHKMDELNLVKEIILREAPQTGMLILFGSYARGGWVEDKYREGHITYEYKSDFDILALVAKGGDARCYPLGKISSLVSAEKRIKTPVSLIVHTADDFNSSVRRAEYFFCDVKREGAIIHDSGKFKLERLPGKISMALRYENAKEDYAVWFEYAEDFFEQYKFARKKADTRRSFLNISAFDLHQAAEHAYTALILTFTGYKPKLHDLEKLGEQAVSFNAAFIAVFPKQEPEDKRRFELLKSAYVDARYKKTYSITAEELDWLAGRVKKLHALTEKVCAEKLASLKTAARPPAGLKAAVRRKSRR
jgi:HEPN domain-containing protein/predicted nucleotidyltransferase